MPILKRVRVIGAKIETTAGTAETITASEAVFNAYDISIQPTIGWNERPAQGSFSALPGVVGTQAGTVSFKTELFGDGAGGTPTWASTLFPACAFTETATVFTPKSDSPGSVVKTITLAIYTNGMRKALRGCSGTFKVMFTTGNIVVIEWTFTGVWVTPTDATILAPTYPTLIPVRFSNPTSFTIGGSAVTCLETMTIDIGNEVILRPCQSATDGSGISYAMITGRKPKLTMNPEARLVATEAVHTLWVAGTTTALVLNFQTVTDAFVFLAPAMQRVNVQEGERSGMVTDEIEFNLCKSAAAGNDELSLEFNIAS